ncbi:hypothetical protein PMZ80_002803 [Knufia obscura]|uniref:Tautomerase cis-CaaD-like domain-containing protein n=1 Tax=Knufia obscura TaxID=1635080 RepID=A0ABR0RYD7_9EURO|nr:hypothetical protein PMZ80_002803 [Knufia obscura]
MNQNSLAIMLARKRNQIPDIETLLYQRYPERTLHPSRDQNYNPEPQLPHHYQPPYTTVPTDLSYPASPQELYLNAHPPHSTPKPWLDTSRYKLRDTTPTHTHPETSRINPFFSFPVPQPRSIPHALLIRDALTKFHTAVYLADATTLHNENLRKEYLAAICDAYMPAMERLGIAKHQIVFFYHGRVEIDMGNEVWDAMGEWEGRMGRKREGELRGWRDFARRSETVWRVRGDSGFGSTSFRGRGGRRERVVGDEEWDWPGVEGGQW